MIIFVGLTITFSKRIVGPGLSQRWLIGLWLFRVIGLLFVLEWAEGNLTPVFAHPSDWGDLAADAT